MDNNYTGSPTKPKVSKVSLEAVEKEIHGEKPKVKAVTKGKVDKGLFGGVINSFNKVRNTVDTVTPYVRNAMRIIDIVVSATDSILYGKPSGYKIKNNYTKVSYSREPAWKRDSLPWNDNSAGASIGFGNVRVESRAAAKEVLNAVYEHIQEFKYATVANLYEAADVDIPLGETSFNRYGWSDISSARIEPSLRGGYNIIMPKPMMLED